MQASHRSSLGKLFDVERRGYSKEQVDQYISETRHREIKLLDMVEHLKIEVRIVAQQRNWEIKGKSQGVVGIG